MFNFIKKLFRKEKREIVLPEHLSREDQKKVRKIIKNAQKDDGVPRTTQQSIPFDRMFQDGICRVGADYYTKTIHFQDINYQLAQQEDQTEIFEEWCSFLNFFDSSVHFQLSFMNMATDAEDFEKSIAIMHRKDDFNEVRDEYTGMLKRQMEAGNNGLTKTKYLTFGIHADSMKTAKPRLMHIEMDLLNNFKRLGVQAVTLNGRERLELMHQQFHMGDPEKFCFDWKWLVPSGLSVKDFIARHQIDAAGWFVANPQVTVVDVRRLQRMEKAVNEMMDEVAGTDLDNSGPKALKAFLDKMSQPKGVDY